MNTVRKISLYLGIACFLAGCLAGGIAFVTSDGTGNYELALSLCGAALFFAAPYAIIPARKPGVMQRDRLELLGEFCASAFYAGVLIAISIMGFQYIEALYSSSGSPSEPMVQAGFAIFFAGFGASLLIHLAGALLALTELLKSPKEPA